MSFTGTGLDNQVMIVWLVQSYKLKFLCFTFFSKKVISLLRAQRASERVGRATSTIIEGLNKRLWIVRPV